MLEMIHCLMFDAATQPGVFDHVVVNDTVEDAYVHLKGILMTDISKLKEQKGD
eukprot:m.23307 g.23307  ORF g.23307 m.23307 type:complete len:53 (+) comp28456_c0_seq1:974-1132(+)